MPHRKVTICLELDVAGDEVCGRALSPAHDPKPFAGWLGLLAVLDDLLADPAPDEPAPDAVRP
jgi:hypothetical protein